MPPVLPDGRYRLCISTGTEPYYIAPLPDKPDMLGVLPGDPSRGPIFTLTYVDDDDEYNIMLGDRWIDKKEDGEICLDLPVHKQWKIVPKGASFMIKGGQESCWSPVSLPQDPDIYIKDTETYPCDLCRSVVGDCNCAKKPCEVADCECNKEQPENVRALVRAMLQSHPDPGPVICSCSGCPPVCVEVNPTPA